MSEFRHPAKLLGWISYYERIGRNVFRDHRTRPDESIRSDVIATNDGGVRADAGPSSHMGAGVLTTAVDCAAGVDHIGEHAAGAEEYVVIARDTFVDGDVVLDFDVGAEAHAR